VRAVPRDDIRGRRGRKKCLAFDPPNP